MLSVQDSNGKININIYPNPVSNILNIKTEGIASSEIYDMNGRKVLTSESKIISVDKLTPGNYSVKVKVGNAFKTFKFIKK